MRWDFGTAGTGASWRALGLKTAGAHSKVQMADLTCDIIRKVAPCVLGKI